MSKHGLNYDGVVMAYMDDPKIIRAVKAWDDLALTVHVPWIRDSSADTANGARWLKLKLGQVELVAITSVAVERDDRLWLHVSASTRLRVPMYSELTEVHRLFCGDRKAMQIFVPKAEHINIHPNVLHLWCCLEADPLPDFRHGGAI